MVDLSKAGAADTAQTWSSTFSSGDGREYVQKLDLATGKWLN